MNPLIDLHVHTTASDGIMAPSRLVDFAADSGVVALALTDHDTTDGIDEAVARAAIRGIDVIPGIEFSVDHPVGSFHMVGLFIDHGNRKLQEIITYLKERRSTRIHRMIDDLKMHGIDISLDEVIALSDGGSPGRPHVARVLVKHGFAPSVKDVFQHFLVPGKPGFVKKDKVTAEVALAGIRDAGGIPVLAHPVSMEYASREEFERSLARLIDSGLQGVEAYAYMHTKEEVEYYRSAAVQQGLIVTGGSDYHGDKDEKIGWYAEDSPIPYELYGELLRFRKANHR